MACSPAQLSLVEAQLEAGSGGADTADLEQLKDNLSELISLTEGNSLHYSTACMLYFSVRCFTGAQEAETTV